MNQRATENNLNKEEFEQLKEVYVSTIVDSMSMEDLQQYVTNDMEDFCNNLSESELINEINYTQITDLMSSYIRCEIAVASGGYGAALWAVIFCNIIASVASDASL